MNESAGTLDRSPRIMIVTAGVGAGHNQAARALQTALLDARPDVDLSIVDTMDLAPRWFRAYYAGGFALAMTRFPKLYGLGFWLTNRPQRPGRGLSERLRLWEEFAAMKAFRRHMLAERPDIVLHTHFLAAPIIARMMRRGELATRQMVVMTDNDPHRWWYSEDVDHWFSPADFSVETLRRWGIPAEQITVSGIPIHPKWTAPLDTDAIRNEWQLPHDKKVVLLTGGTEFTCGPIVRIARGIAAACEDAYVVVLAGRNKKLLGRLSRYGPKRRIVGQGFTDRVHELVEVASIMVTKPGGVTTAECLCKGTPMIFLKPVPGQEGDNAKYFRREGAAVITQKPREVITAVRRLLNDRTELTERSARARALYRPAVQTIVQHLCDAM